ncbi:MAG: RidA family protein [Actinocatenispora sp.]
MARIAAHPASAPPSGGPYSPSVRIGALVAVAGQCGYRPDRSLVDGLAAQTRLALENLRDALAASGGTPDDVLSVEVFLTDRDDFAGMNTVYAEFFTEPYPARTTIYVGLRAGVLVEVSALAVLPDTPGT